MDTSNTTAITSSGPGTSYSARHTPEGLNLEASNPALYASVLDEKGALGVSGSLVICRPVADDPRESCYLIPHSLLHELTIELSNSRGLEPQNLAPFTQS